MDHRDQGSGSGVVTGKMGEDKQGTTSSLSPSFSESKVGCYSYLPMELSHGLSESVYRHILAWYLTHSKHLVLVNMISHIITISFHLLRLHSSLDYDPQGPHVKRLVSWVALLEGYGAFRRWGLV